MKRLPPLWRISGRSPSGNSWMIKVRAETYAEAREKAKRRVRGIIDTIVLIEGEVKIL